MHRLWRVALVTLAIASSRPATADPAELGTDLGGWFGPRLFSSSSRLGYITNAPAHPVLDNSIALGARVARPVLPWLVPELELALSPTSTDAVGGAASANVLWLEPRLHLRFELRPEDQIQPFVIVGGGAPISLSGASQTFGTSVIGDGYVGGGVHFDTKKGFGLRLDARLAILPSHSGSSFALTAELEVGIGLEFRIGSHKPTAAELELARRNSLPDRDKDGIPDAQDACLDRPEDVDGFEDDDGCPDIDNDFDRVLDIADKCPNVPEKYNGFEDDDGCPDTLPPEVDALRGTIEGLLYTEGETAVHESAGASLRVITKTMQSHPSIRVQLIGHTDDREAKALAAGDEPLEAVAMDLSKARAGAVKNALIALGIPASRIIVEGRGGDDPVADNSKPRGRQANRRVEIKLYVPVR